MIAGSTLLERDAELATLDAAVDRAQAGQGSVVLLHGEAGIGKTSVVRAFARRTTGRARLLVGGCEELITPRPFGALRDALRTATGELADALRAGTDRDAVLTGARAELTGPAPTVLVVEDAHWADEATLALLRHLGRRAAELTAVLLLTYRDDELGPDHPLRGVLGGLAGPRVHRIGLRPLSRAAVSRLAGGTELTTAALFRTTGGNPFFVTEALATPGPDVPPTVREAVLARLRRLDEPTRTALEQLSVVPGRAELWLVRRLLGEPAVLGEAERLGVVEVRPDAVAFRHELARRVVAGALPAAHRMRLDAAVLAALRAAPDPDEARIVHHAVAAGDDAAVVAHAPAAARRAYSAGARHEGKRLHEEILLRSALLDRPALADVLEDYSWALLDLDLAPDAVAAAERAVAVRQGLGEPAALGRAVAGLGLLQWSDLRVGAARASAARAVELLSGAGPTEPHAAALVFVGTTLVNLDREADALRRLDDALALARELGAAHLVPRGLLYRGRARAQLGEPAGVEEMLEAIALARAVPDHRTVLLGYLTVVMVLWFLGRYPELEQRIAEATGYAEDEDLPVVAVGLESYRCRLLALHGDYPGAAAGLRRLARDGNQSAARRLVLPPLARVLVRLGAVDADAVVEAAWQVAEAADSAVSLVPAGLARLERAWLTGRRDGMAELGRLLLSRTDRPGQRRQHREVRRHLRRLGLSDGEAPTDPDAPDLRDDPYEQALERASSGVATDLLEAVSALDGLGARPAAALLRARLRELGIAGIPPGPQRAARENPAGLTARQIEILRLLGGGLADAEIAARLRLSVRTVDRHVSAILLKLGVPGRREAAAAAVDLGIVPGPGT